MKNTDIIIFDTETTGLLAPTPTNIDRQPYLTEVYIIRLDKDFNFVSEMETMVRPPIPIPEEITRITGITQEDADKAPSFIEIYDKLYDIFEGVNYMAGHNINFDKGVIKYELFRHDFEEKFHWPKHHLCSVEASRHYKNKRLKLSQLYELLFNSSFQGAHRARADVEATARCFMELVKRGDIEYPIKKEHE